MQVRAAQQVHDVVIVGSGAAGGMAAYVLASKGINVLMLDAGEVNRAKFWTHVKPWEARARLAKGEAPPRFEVDVKEQPYTYADGQPFDLVRVWGRGGKTNIWGRVSLRYSDLDFTSADRDGWEIPWPIRYKDIAPYYDRVEQLIGVNGGDDDQDSLPGSKYHLPPPPLRCGEILLQRAAKSRGINIVHGRRAVLTKPYNGHNACHYCGSCGRGCDVAAFFNSSDYLIEPTMKTGKLKVIDNAVVARVLTGDDGLANGVQYFDRNTKEEHTVRARVVVMAASCIDSTRILLNSKSSRHPNGIGNSSDVIGVICVSRFVFTCSGSLRSCGAPRRVTMMASAASISICRDSTIAPARRITYAGMEASSGTLERRPMHRGQGQLRALARSSRLVLKIATLRWSPCIHMVKFCPERRTAFA